MLGLWTKTLNRSWWRVGNGGARAAAAVRSGRPRRRAGRTCCVWAATAVGSWSRATSSRSTAMPVPAAMTGRVAGPC